MISDEEMVEPEGRYLFGLMQIEDHFATICVTPAWIRLTNKADLVFDGEFLKVAMETRHGDHLFFDPFDDDFHGESHKHSFDITVASLAEMKDRLEDDASQDPVEILMVTHKLQQFLKQLREGMGIA